MPESSKPLRWLRQGGVLLIFKLVVGVFYYFETAEILWGEGDMAPARNGGDWVGRGRHLGDEAATPDRTVRMARPGDRVSGQTERLRQR
jgi:hypothetical protein